MGGQSRNRLPMIGCRDSVPTPSWIHSRSNQLVTAAQLRRLLPSEGSAMTTSRLLAAAAASALVVVGLVACAPPEKKDTGNQTESGVNAKEATSAADFGGMDGLVKAAKAEGELNVIALPPDWANYKEIIDTFSAEVRHQGELRPARRQQPGRDQRRQPAEGQEHRARRLRPGTGDRVGEHLPVRAVQGGDIR